MNPLTKLIYYFKRNDKPSVEICIGNGSPEALNQVADVCECIAMALRETVNNRFELAGERA
jgi:hypothetical protein